MNVLQSHTQEWHDNRRQGIGGSDAAKIMAGDWLDLWEDKTGRREPEDLSGVLQVQLGTWTEEFNRLWFCQQTNRVVSTKDCEHLIHPDYSFMRANLDGRMMGGEIFEAKHTSAFAKDEEIVTRYFPQIQHYLAVVGAVKCHLSVIFGNHKWAAFEIERDDDYIAKLIEKEAEFWSYVERDEPPPSQEAHVVEIAFDEMREVDMTGNNAWAVDAEVWLGSKAAAKDFADCTKDLKEKVEPDVKLAFGHGIKISRSKAGALTVREMK